jgi:hypothetical protein
MQDGITVIMFQVAEREQYSELSAGGGDSAG